MATARSEITLFPRTSAPSDKTKYSQTVTAHTAIPAGSLCAFTENGLEALAAGVSFDTGQPVLYSPSAVSAGAETSDLYIYYCGADARTITGDNSFTADSGATLYIRGALNGNALTLPAAGTDWLVDDPDSADYIYMAVGRADEGLNVHELAYINDNQLYVCDYDGNDYTLTKIEEWVKVLSQESAETIADIDTVVMKYGGETSTLTSWMTFDGDNYLMIGSSTNGEANKQKVKITPTEISFWYGNTKMAYMDNEGFYFTKGTVNTSLKVGNYLIKDDGDGGFAIV